MDPIDLTQECDEVDIECEDDPDEEPTEEVTNPPAEVTNPPAEDVPDEAWLGLTCQPKKKKKGRHAEGGPNTVAAVAYKTPVRHHLDKEEHYRYGLGDSGGRRAGG